MKTVAFIHIYSLNKRFGEIEMVFELALTIFVIKGIVKGKMHLDLTSNLIKICIQS